MVNTIVKEVSKLIVCAAITTVALIMDAIVQLA
jgi:hypothetical protein